MWRESRMIYNLVKIQFHTLLEVAEEHFLNEFVNEFCNVTLHYR